MIPIRRSARWESWRYMRPSMGPALRRSVHAGAGELLHPLELDHATHTAPLAGLHDIEVAARIAPDAMAGAMDRCTPTCQSLAVQCQNADHAAVVLGDVHNIV